jgi:hypothetical protein
MKEGHKHDNEKEKEKIYLSETLATNNGSNDNADSMSINVGTKSVEWSPENELIMVEWCDIAQCYKWLNARAHQNYSYMNAWFTIPAIVLSTISGTASFAQTSLPIAYQTYSPMAIGAVNIFIGILTTVQQYLKIAELNEAHRVSSISWDKFARNIRIELAKKPDERMDAAHFLKLNRQEFDRLMETSPIVNTAVVNEFNKKFKGKEGTIERKRFDELKKPDICDIIVSANETRHHWYLELNKPVENTDFDVLNASEQIIKSKEEAMKTKDELIQLQQLKITDKEVALKKKQQDEIEALKRERETIEFSKKIATDLEKQYIEKSKCLSEYVLKFEETFGRKPSQEEITDNMKEEVEAKVLMRFLITYLVDNV